MSYSIEHSFVVNDWIVNSENCQELILYLISVQLHIHFAKYLTVNDLDQRFVEIGDLEIFVHDNVYKSIRFKAIAGTGYKLPRIHYNGGDVRQDNCASS